MGAVEEKGTGETNEIKRGRVVTHAHGATSGNAVNRKMFFYRNTYHVMNCHLKAHTVCGQNTIGIYITTLVLIQPTDVKQNVVNNNWLLKLQPAVKLQSWQKSNFHQIE